ncbi:hypothetical protein POM88_013259, partial [Heracleum sosnowskyi]
NGRIKRRTKDSVLPAVIIPGTPNQKRRWSFGKSEASTDNNHKTSRSLDAIDSKRLVPLDLLEYRSEQNNGANHLVTIFVAAKYEQEYTITVHVPNNEAATYRVVSARFAAAKHFRAIADAAATKIQAFFRAHLPISLCTFSSSNTAYIFAASKTPTVLYSSNEKLLYGSVVDLKEVRHLCPLNSAYFPDSLAFVEEDRLSIGTMDYPRFTIHSIPLEEEAVKVCQQDYSRTYALC